MVVPSHQIAYERANYEVNDAENQLKWQNIGKVFVQQLVMPGNFTATKAFDAKIKNYLKNKNEIEKNEIITIFCCPYCILDSYINAKSINGFNKKIEKK
jgi:hypothetical protein